MKKLAIITSHPIQYNAPLFRLLMQRGKIDLKVFYTWGQTESGFVYDPDFKKEFKWDIPLLDGYEKEFVENVSPNPGAGHFRGIKNRDLVKRIDHFDPDALLVFGWSFQSHLQILRHYKGKRKIIFRGDSTLLDEKPGLSLKKLARRLFLTWVYKHIDVALYTGEANKAYYLKHGIKVRQLYHAPHAIDNERFDDRDGKFEEMAKLWRSELGIREDEIVFLFAGKLEPKKNPFGLVEAFTSIESDLIRLLIVGNGLLEDELKQKAVNDKRILFLDFQNQQKMPVVYRLGDVFVLPSKGPGETWGLSVNEAMASSRPVIVSNKCGCFNELVKHNGKVFSAEDPGELNEVLRFFLKSKQELELMGANSRQLIQSYSYENTGSVIEDAV